MDLFVGTYSSANSGVYPLYPQADGTWSLGDPEPAIENASFSTYSLKTGLHYMVDERPDGRVGVWKQAEGGAWSCLASVTSGGAAPCHIAVDADATRLAVANYESGEVALFQLNTEGLPQSPAIYSHHGHGPIHDRQDGPHAHCVQFSGTCLYSTDLGTDEVLAHPLEPGGAFAGDTFTAFKSPPGQGPRHILFHPALPVAYLLTELGSRVFVLKVEDNGGLMEQQQMSTLPADFVGKSLGGHIALNRSASLLYVSNRGHDSVSVFAIGTDGRLALRQNVQSHGRSPRHFRLLEDRGQMVIAHEEGESVAVLELRPDGTIGQCLQNFFPVAKPAYIGQAAPS
jgi:6-phosphogluconolactonase